ncbi:MAG: protein kinase, partial [Lachnospiraceae bacterium]|nr:protein kinase [Lachnospiraceae bacterium]
MQFSDGKILENTYEILEELNSGGAGIVYRARHLRLDTDVVVKKIKAEVIDKIQIRQEADILKQLKHPYLPRVYDFIEASDGVYTVMDFIQGENLQDAVKKCGKFTQKEVRKWAEQLGEALSYLHSQKP